MFKKIRLLIKLLIITVLLAIYDVSLTYGSDISSIEINADSGESLQIQLLLIDPDGNKTGFDFPTNTDIDQIPNSGHDTENIPGIPPTSTIVVDTPKSGTYHLKIRGTALTTYTLEFRIADNLGNIHAPYFEGVTALGIITTYSLNYDPIPGAKPTVVRVATIQSTRQDVTLSYNVGWITNAGVVKSLMAKLDAAEQSIARGQKKTVANQLNAFINEVKAQITVHIKPECVKMLIEDAEYILKHL